MDKESNPNAVYRHDPNSQIIYPVDGKTNQPLSEISKYVMSNKKREEFVNKGMIRNFRWADLSKGENKREHTYFADFVIDVFVVPDEDKTVENVKLQLDTAFETLGLSNTTVESLTQDLFNKNKDLLEEVALETYIEKKVEKEHRETFNYNELKGDEKIKCDNFIKNFLQSSKEKYAKYLDEENYFRHNPNTHQYVEKKSDNLWILQPKFENFRLPFEIIEMKKRPANVREIYANEAKKGDIISYEDTTQSLVYFNMKLVVSVLSRDNALISIKKNRTMANFYVYLSDDISDSKNLFNGSNLIFMSSEQLSDRKENLFFHEVGHALFKYGTQLEYGKHNIDNNDSYMSGSAKYEDRKFTKKDLFALSLPWDRRTYGILVDNYANYQKKRKTKDKNAIASKKEKEELRNHVFSYNLDIADLDYLSCFNLSLNEAKITNSKVNYDTANEVKIVSYQIKYPVIWTAFGLYQKFIFYKQNIEHIINFTDTNPDRDSIEYFESKEGIKIDGKVR